MKAWWKTIVQMGAGSSAEVPGGGTEGYHVLRVSTPFFFERRKEERRNNELFKINDTCFWIIWTLFTLRIIFGSTLLVWRVVWSDSNYFPSINVTKKEWDNVGKLSLCNTSRWGNKTEICYKNYSFYKPVLTGVWSFKSLMDHVSAWTLFLT